MLHIQEDGTGLSLNINLDDNALTLDLSLEVVEYFRLDTDSGLKIIDRLKKSVSNWRMPVHCLNSMLNSDIISLRRASFFFETNLFISRFCPDLTSFNRSSFVI